METAVVNDEAINTNVEVVGVVDTNKTINNGEKRRGRKRKVIDPNIITVIEKFISETSTPFKIPEIIKRIYPTGYNKSQYLDVFTYLRRLVECGKLKKENAKYSKI